MFDSPLPPITLPPSSIADVTTKDLLAYIGAPADKHVYMKDTRDTSLPLYERKAAAVRYLPEGFGKRHFLQSRSFLFGYTDDDLNHLLSAAEEVVSNNMEIDYNIMAMLPASRRPTWQCTEAVIPYFVLALTINAFWTGQKMYGEECRTALESTSFPEEIRRHCLGAVGLSHQDVPHSNAAPLRTNDVVRLITTLMSESERGCAPVDILSVVDFRTLICEMHVGSDIREAVRHNFRTFPQLRNSALKKSASHRYQKLISWDGFLDSLQIGNPLPPQVRRDLLSMLVHLTPKRGEVKDWLESTVPSIRALSDDGKHALPHLFDTTTPKWATPVIESPLGAHEDEDVFVDWDA